MNTKVGMEVMEPFSPSWTGGPPVVARTKPDAYRDGGLQFLGHGPENRGPRAGDTKQDDQDAVDDHQAHGLGPGDLLDDGDGEEGVDAEAGSKTERQVGD